jgi:hypothetical protein
MRSFHSVTATRAEAGEQRSGDDIVVAVDAVMDRAFTVPGTPQMVFPWIRQLGKSRAGWYLPRSVERLLPVRRRALRHIEPRWQHLRPGDIVPDYGGANATFAVESIEAPHSLVYRSQRGQALVSWSILLRPIDTDLGDYTRILLRLRVGAVRHPWLVRTAGEALDRITITAMAAGLVERLIDVSV